MIAVDTSALMAILLDEPEADACSAALEMEDSILISAGTLAEVLIVAARRNVADELSSLIDGLGLEIVSVSSAAALRIAEAYQQWGKGIHPAGLNFGDCFAYEVAKTHSCPLLYVGDDFSKTDVRAVTQSAHRSLGVIESARIAFSAEPKTLRMARPQADRPGSMTETGVDSDVVSFLFKNHPIGQLYEADVAGRARGISFMTVDELERWALLCRWNSHLIRWLQLFIARFTVVPSNPDLCRKWAEVMVAAQAAGRMQDRVRQQTLPPPLRLDFVSGAGDVGRDSANPKQATQRA